MIFYNYLNFLKDKKHYNYQKKFNISLVSRLPKLAGIWERIRVAAVT